MLRRSKPYQWLNATFLDATPVGVGQRRLDNVLIKIRGGAILIWTFDSDEQGDSRLVLSLSPREVSRFLRSIDASQGMLEAVRGSLKNPESVLSRDGMEPHFYQVPRELSEEDFLDNLFAEVESLQPAPAAAADESVAARGIFRRLDSLVEAQLA